MIQTRTVTAIVAMTKDRIIGKNGDLPWHYSEDLKRFKRKTIDSTIVMGRKTWESIGSRPLPRRRNIVISSSKLAAVECYNSIERTLEQLAGRVWIIGGGQIYQAALEFCDAVDVTWIPETIEGKGLIRFPELDRANWQAQELITNEFDPRLRHQLYIRVTKEILDQSLC